MKTFGETKKVLFADGDVDERALFETVYQGRKDIEVLPWVRGYKKIKLAA